MKYWNYDSALAVLSTVLVISAVIIYYNYAPQQHSASARPDVMVTYNTYSGHGSATHIGNGYFLTAAHVVKDGHTPIITDEFGVKGEAEVLWVNSKYNVALLRASAINMDSADLDCRTPNVGEELTMHGNPLNLRDITTWGRVAGIARYMGPWASVFPLDGTIGGGMSGGATYDADGDIVGINVGVALHPGIMSPMTAQTYSPIGIAYVVPAEMVCMLMGIK